MSKLWAILKEQVSYLPCSSDAAELEVLGLDCSACWIPAATAPAIACTFRLAMVNHHTCGHEVALIRTQPVSV